MAICACCGDGGLPHTLKTTSNGSSQKCYSDGNRILTGKSEFMCCFYLFFSIIHEVNGHRVKNIMGGFHHPLTIEGILNQK